jgi:hypothetical protein
MGNSPFPSSLIVYMVVFTMYIPGHVAAAGCLRRSTSGHSALPWTSPLGFLLGSPLGSPYFGHMDICTR